MVFFYEENKISMRSFLKRPLGRWHSSSQLKETRSPLGDKLAKSPHPLRAQGGSSEVAPEGGHLLQKRVG